MGYLLNDEAVRTRPEYAPFTYQLGFRAKNNAGQHLQTDVPFSESDVSFYLGECVISRASEQPAELKHMRRI